MTNGVGGGGAQQGFSAPIVLLSHTGSEAHLQVLHQQLPRRLDGELPLGSGHGLAIFLPGDAGLRAATGRAGQEGVGAFGGGQVREASLDHGRDCGERRAARRWGLS